VTQRRRRLLRAVVRRRPRSSISGGTGSGKTTLLGALLSLADPGERLVLVEDSHELRPTTRTGVARGAAAQPRGRG
jgi:pilus assembly protein CpaF